MNSKISSSIGKRTCPSFFSLALIASIVVVSSSVFAQDAADLSDGQKQIQKLSFMVGEWDVTEKDGTVKPMSIRLINNRSFLELVFGEYREIIRWDVVEKCFVTQAFGEVGGHAKFSWKDVGQDTWEQTADPAYYVADGTAVPRSTTLKRIDKDTMSLSGTMGNHKIEDVARRRKPQPETDVAKAWREYFVGNWIRESEWTVDGKTTTKQEKWSCQMSGPVIVVTGVTGDGMASVMSWDAARHGLFEHGSTSQDNWEILFVPATNDSMSGRIVGRLADGREGTGMTVITRESANSYTATTSMKLNDGSTFQVLDKNTRKQ
ncbi:MAG: hypothetical protein R3C28_11390 [Pirellulaceae bacterium]